MFTKYEIDYDLDSLAPNISADTMKVHSQKHHQGYTDKLNAAVEGTDFASWTIEELLSKLSGLPESIRGAVQNNGGGFYNHDLFFSIISPDAQLTPDGEIMDRINNDFGSFDAFKEEFEKAALTRFGSGWAWLVDNGGTLEVTSTPNQDNPLMEGKKPLIGLDVWEHAYYLDYQNRRADYIKNFWNILDWKKVG